MIIIVRIWTENKQNIFCLSYRHSVKERQYNGDTLKAIHHFGRMTIIQHLRLVISITALSQNLSTVHLIMRENMKEIKDKIKQLLIENKYYVGNSEVAKMLRELADELDD